MSKDKKQVGKSVVLEMVEPEGSAVSAQGSMILEKLPGYFLVICLVGAFVALFYLLQDFLTPIFLAMVFATVFYPMHTRIAKKMGKWKGPAAFISCLIIVAVIVLPTSLLMVLLASEALQIYNDIAANFDLGKYDGYLAWNNGGFFYEQFQNLNAQIKPVIDLEALDLKNSVLNVAKSLSEYLVVQVQVLFGKFIFFFIGLLVMLLSLFYFLKDGKMIMEKVSHVSPLPARYEEQLFGKIVSMVNAIVFGVFLTAIMQGFIGGIGFLIVGIDNWIFWAFAMAFLSILPMIGTAFIWGPAVLFLFFSGHYFAALFLLLWGVFLVGSVDNILRGFLIGGKAHTYSLATFLVILGGVFTLGLKGVIVGPLVLMVLLSFLHIYESEYGKVLKS